MTDLLRRWLGWLRDIPLRAELGGKSLTQCKLDAVAEALTAARAQGERAGYQNGHEDGFALGSEAGCPAAAYAQGVREERERNAAELERLQSANDMLTEMADAAEKWYWAVNRATLDTVGCRERVFDALRLLGRYPPPDKNIVSPEPQDSPRL